MTDDNVTGAGPAMLAELAARIDAVRGDAPVRVAIDGRTASGKTTFADHLARALEDRGRKALRVSIDAFHNPRSVRYRRGRHSAEGYYHDARDLDAVVSLLLAPLGPLGDRRIAVASLDLDSDEPLPRTRSTAPDTVVLIMDGTFLQRPELSPEFDVAVYLVTSDAVSEGRGIGRDAERLGGREAAERLYAERYRPAFRLYDGIARPAQAADATVDNDDFANPVLVIRPGGRLDL